MTRYELYRDSESKWRWRFVAKNGETIAVSSESYENKADAENSIDLIKDNSDAPLWEVE